jgi:cytochrome c553
MKRIKLIVIALLLMPAMAVIVFNSGPAKAVSTTTADTATDYKAKCAMCHGPKAAKSFDETLPEADMVQAILKGKKAEKPPHMPAFETKGITEDKAKELIAYMKELKAATPK